MSIASRVSRRYALCPAKPKHSLVVISLFAMWCKIPSSSPGCVMASNPVGVRRPIRFGEGYELDLRSRRLRRGTHLLKLERIPLEILVLLVEHQGDVVTRDEIVATIWGKDVFLDTDNSIRGAIRKVRQVLKDDPEQPRFIQT